MATAHRQTRKLKTFSKENPAVYFKHKPPPRDYTGYPPREREARKKRTGKRKKKEKSMEKRAPNIAPKSSRISKLVTIGNLKLDLLININLIKELVERARADT